MIAISSKMGRLLAGLRSAGQMDKLASEATGEDLEQVLLAKRKADSSLFDLAKEASALDGIRGGLSAAWNHPVAGKMLAGGAAAAGAAVPAVIAGNMISDHATEQARNRALEAGAGLAGLGATMYGLHRMTSNAKTAMEEDLWLTRAVEKLASIGYLDEILTQALVNADTDSGRKEAADLRDLNREYGIEILRNLTA
jgi:hypothetical protein